MTEIYQKYRAQADKLEQDSFFARTDECHRLFEGDQWYGLDTEGQRLPVYNIIQPIVEYKTAMVAQNQVSLQFSPAEYGAMTGGRGPREEACRLLTAYARRQWERLNMDSLVWDMVRAACVAGDSYLFFYDGEGRAQVLDRANVILADESCPDLQQQSWIILAERRDPEQLRREAKAAGCGREVLDRIRADEEQDGLGTTGDGKCLSLLYMEKKPGGIAFTRCTREAVYGRETLIPGLTRYPMAAFVWNRRRGSARGIGEAEPLAANQIEINKTLARRLLNAKLTAYARPVYNAELIEDPAALGEVGTAIAVSGMGVSDVRDAVGYLSPAPLSGDARQLSEELITYSRLLAGAGDAAIGQVDPTQASGVAIIAVRDQAAFRMNAQAAAFRRMAEEVGRIWLELWICYHPAGLETDSGRVEPGLLRQLQVDLRVDVTPDTAWSSYAREQSLEQALAAGHITFGEYVEALPESAAAPRSQFRTILKTRKEREADGMPQL